MKSYYEIQLSELVEKAGGRKRLKSLKEKGISPYSTLLKIQDDFIMGLLYEYREVGEVFPSEIMDYCDNLYRG